MNIINTMQNGLLILVNLTFVYCITAQESFRIISETTGPNARRLVGAVSSSSTGTVSSDLAIMSSVYEAGTNNVWGELNRLNSREQLTGSWRIDGQQNCLELIKVVEFENKLYALAFSFNMGEQGKSDLLAICFDPGNGSVCWSKILEQKSQFIPGRAFLVVSGSDLFASYTISDTLNNTKNIICRFNQDNMIWKSQWSVNGHPAYPLGLTLNSNSHLFLAAMVKETSAFRNLILRVEEDGQLSKAASYRFFNATGAEYNNGLHFAGLEANKDLLHLCVQPSGTGISIDELGPVYITMIDEDLALKTWRNYFSTMLVTDFKISTGRFLLGGPQDILSGKDGYTLVAINNTNAIPEITSVFKDGFPINSRSADNNGSITGMGARGIALAATNTSDITKINVITQADNTLRGCNETFTFKVAKDPIQTAEFAGIEFTQTETMTPLVSVVTSMTPIKAGLEIICKATGIEEVSESKNIAILSQSHEQLVVRIPQSINSTLPLDLVDCSGRKILLKKSIQNERDVVIDISQLVPGYYVLQTGVGRGLPFVQF
ncbi:MAG: hypothetical protein K1X68_05540 [Saprospiraceae bacterium]|nr:hypothetical protein [Saprospiraceae bacterium]HMW39688.1 hypothetical protein [Saprospiraceae bacterium]HMX88831.1 hypothetical protein [Saprospiraceae bacterium]HMZ39305.1 hypothetical protein [Saprospiraceae bacterium]HNA65699.1 hypothetical protein [Saprospiraceae bacterium]